MKQLAITFCTAAFLFACNSEDKKVADAKAEEPKKTEISVGPGGAEVKTKSGTEIKVDEKGAKAGNKDVKIDIKKDNDQ